MEFSPAVLALGIYCLLILLASLVGGWVPMMVRLTHQRMELAVSFVAGVMLGVGLMHMLPHAIMSRVEARAADVPLAHADLHLLLGPIVLWLVAGFLFMFLIERFFHFHYHDAPAAQEMAQAAASEDAHDHAHEHSHGHAQHRNCAGDHVHARPHHHQHDLKWGAAAVGLSLHSLIEGIALASTVHVAQHADELKLALLAGFGTFLVIFLHKPFDSLTLGALMSMSGRSMRFRHIVNIAFSLLIPVGVLVFYAGLTTPQNEATIASAALAFSAGTFLCISMSDLLPELQFHRHDRVKLSVALLAGLAVAWGISVFEARMHPHDHGHEVAGDQHDPEHHHDHEHHDHTGDHEH